MSDTDRPPQRIVCAALRCPSTAYDRATGHDTRCIYVAGHEGQHSDGCLLWCEEGDCRCEREQEPEEREPHYRPRVAPATQLDRRHGPSVDARWYKREQRRAERRAGRAYVSAALAGELVPEPPRRRQFRGYE